MSIFEYERRASVVVVHSKKTQQQQQQQQQTQSHSSFGWNHKCDMKRQNTAHLFMNPRVIWLAFIVIYFAFGYILLEYLWLSPHSVFSVSLCFSISFILSVYNWYRNGRNCWRRLKMYDAFILCAREQMNETPSQKERNKNEQSNIVRKNVLKIVVRLWNVSSHRMNKQQAFVIKSP